MTKGIGTLDGGQLTLSAQLIKPNYPARLPHQRSNYPARLPHQRGTTDSLGNLPLYSLVILYARLYFQKKTFLLRK